MFLVSGPTLSAGLNLPNRYWKGENVAAIKVLLVDQADQAGRLRQALENEPELALVGSAPESRLADLDLTELRPDVLVWRLNEIQELDLLPRIRTSYRRLRVVVVLPQTDSFWLHQALKAGAQGVLSDRLTDRSLADAIRAVNAGGTFISGEASNALLNDYLGLYGGVKTGPLQLLSQRERQVFDLVLEGKTSVQIAQQLAISSKSVDTYRGRLMFKIGVTSLPGLLAFAVENGLTPRPIS